MHAGQGQFFKCQWARKPIKIKFSIKPHKSAVHIYENILMQNNQTAFVLFHGKQENVIKNIFLKYLLLA